MVKGYHAIMKKSTTKEKRNPIRKSPSFKSPSARSSYKNTDNLTNVPSSSAKSKSPTKRNLNSSKSKEQTPKLNTSKKSSRNTDKSGIQKKIAQRRSKFFVVGSKVFKVSAKILREIKKYQLLTTNLIPRLPFSRLVHEILQEYLPNGRIQRSALEALQESIEGYVVQFFEDSNSCALHARRNTLVIRDMALIKHLRKTSL